MLCSGPVSSFLVISDPEAAKHVLRSTDNPKRPIYVKGLVAEVGDPRIWHPLTAVLFTSTSQSKHTPGQCHQYADVHHCHQFTDMVKATAVVVSGITIA